MPKAKVLIIEDDPNSAKLISDFLKVHGYYIVCVTNGKTALQEVAKEAFDIILLDLRLPGQNGFMVAEHLRQSSFAAPLPIIVISAYTDKQNKLRAYQAGVNYFLSKPINTRELLMIVKNLIQQEREKILSVQRNIGNNIEHHLGRTHHTLQVVTHCSHLAQLMNVPSEDQTLLLRAAEFHDAGLLNPQCPEGHEQLSATIARALGLSEDVATIISYHHYLPEGQANKLPANLLPLIEIMQMAEKTEEIYRQSPLTFQEDLQKNLIPSPFLTYLSEIISTES